MADSCGLLLTGAAAVITLQQPQPAQTRSRASIIHRPYAQTHKQQRNTFDWPRIDCDYSLGYGVTIQNCVTNKHVEECFLSTRGDLNAPGVTFEQMQQLQLPLTRVLNLQAVLDYTLDKLKFDEI